MRNGLLLCELHAHTTWSDGCFTLPELVDLYGEADFDVLCVTDHTARLDDPAPRVIDGWSWPGYISEIECEARRALDDYGLLLVPGLEFCENAEVPNDSAHVLALGLHRFVSMEHGLVRALLGARAEGAAIIAAHPYTSSEWTLKRPTCRLWNERASFRDIIDRWELANGKELFGWIVEEGLPLVATGGFHRMEDLASWKTLIPCRKSEREVVAHLRSRAPVYVMPYAAVTSPAALAA
jgi:predicted metal-dependent phosphoesterase TrpH